ncbi:Outer membrane lipoprotein-sorting protein [Enhygromyxa salina]|uniref:Outer membrane lipoprotein-sorting protein n=1 Tax=Enhygromyxa salina TaxID=215803 RepID=A0A0C2D8T5_9BACT|nr:outer membrane lipoprotein-sorting protein [Enhygromyxa salina]KIG16387.1 Outer membrane lipoprotein-sorting protein [Enhygromyxa salina]
MKTSRRFVLSALLVASAAALIPGSAAAAPPAPTDPEFGRYLLTQVDDMHRGKSSHALMSMHVKTSRWERSMTMEAWSSGKEYSLIRILEPKKERGTATLKSNKDLYTFLSKTGRTIKISGASMGGSWMGSHFTNDDLVKESRLDKDFDIIVKDGPGIRGEPTWALILIPKPKAVVVWGQVDVMIRKSDLLPIGQLFYDEDRNPVRKMEFFDYQQVAGRSVPMRMRMSPLDDERKGEYTEMTYSKLEFDIGLDPSFFSVSQLKAL